VPHISFAQIFCQVYFTCFPSPLCQIVKSKLLFGYILPTSLCQITKATLCKLYVKTAKSTFPSCQVHFALWNCLNEFQAAPTNLNLFGLSNGWTSKWSAQAPAQNLDCPSFFLFTGCLVSPAVPPFPSLSHSLSLSLSLFWHDGSLKL